MSGTASMSYQTSDSIGVLQLDDGKANAMRSDWFDALHAALDQAEADDSQVLVLRGRSGMFSGGLDLKFLPTLDASSLPAFTRAFAKAMLRVWTFPMPTVAEVTGHAIAGGCVLASACDRRLGLDGAYRYQMNEHWIGIDLPEWMRAILETAWNAPALERLLVLGDIHSPAQAKQAGMLDAVEADPAALEGRARDAAEGLVNLDTGCVGRFKQRFRQPIAERVLGVLGAS